VVDVVVESLLCFPPPPLLLLLLLMTMMMTVGFSGHRVGASVCPARDAAVDDIDTGGPTTRRHDPTGDRHPRRGQPPEDVWYCVGVPVQSSPSSFHRSLYDTSRCTLGLLRHRIANFHRISNFHDVIKFKYSLSSPYEKVLTS